MLQFINTKSKEDLEKDLEVISGNKPESKFIFKAVRQDGSLIKSFSSLTEAKEKYPNLPDHQFKKVDINASAISDWHENVVSLKSLISSLSEAPKSEDPAKVAPTTSETPSDLPDWTFGFINILDDEYGFETAEKMFFDAFNNGANTPELMQEKL